MYMVPSWYTLAVRGLQAYYHSRLLKAHHGTHARLPCYVLPLAHNSWCDIASNACVGSWRRERGRRGRRGEGFKKMSPFAQTLRPTLASLPLLPWYKNAALYTVIAAQSDVECCWLGFLLTTISHQTTLISTTLSTHFLSSMIYFAWMTFPCLTCTSFLEQTDIGRFQSLKCALLCPCPPRPIKITFALTNNIHQNDNISATTSTQTKQWYFDPQPWLQKRHGWNDNITCFFLPHLDVFV